MNINSVCNIPEDLLETYAWGRLADPDSASLEEHLLICPVCQKHLEEIDDYLSVARAATAALATDTPPGADRSDRKRHNALRVPIPLWAAGFAAIVLITTIPKSGRLNAPTEVDLRTTRAASPFPQARAAVPLLLRIDATEISEANGYVLELVDPIGRPLRRARVEANHDKIVALQAGLDPGRYWIRVYDTGQPSTLLREYGLDVE